MTAARPNKIYNVRIHLGTDQAAEVHDYLVSAQTAAGAKRDVLKMIGVLADAEPATAEQLYEAGRNGQRIIGRDDIVRDDIAQTAITPTAKECVEEGLAVMLHGYGRGAPSESENANVN